MNNIYKLKGLPKFLKYQPKNQVFRLNGVDHKIIKIKHCTKCPSYNSTANKTCWKCNSKLFVRYEHNSCKNTSYMGCPVNRWVVHYTLNMKMYLLQDWMTNGGNY